MKIQSNERYVKVIRWVSVIIPLVVALLLFAPLKFGAGNWISVLPHVIAGINSVTAFLLVLALIAVKQKSIVLHRNLMLTCLILGVIFLVTYIVYHSSAPSVRYGDVDGNGELSALELSRVGFSRKIYVFVLLSHIGMSIGVVPFVLMAFYYALSNQISRHRKLVKFAYPIWLYVSVTGVIVYFMIRDYYLF
ncbi:MAG: DUF420 domain-containing protein [Cyclobacteriaceae bacterium]|nr:DUF420 domain-containing protein [Cyclobacteriaceae bacterium HetDA_MAG_MS6]